MARVKSRSLPEFRSPRSVSASYKEWIASLHCVVTGTSPVEVAHLRFGDPSRGKRPTGAGEKPDDKWTLPLSADMHRLGPDAQHKMGERSFWERKHIDPIKVCLDLQIIYPDTERAERYLASIRNAAQIVSSCDA